MKAIIIKVNDKVIAVSQITEVTSKHYLDLQREAQKTLAKKDEQIVYLENELSKATSNIEELTKKVNYLGKQIAIDRGEIEEDDTNEYVLVVKEEVEPIAESETPEVIEEQPQEESEVSE